MQYYFAVVKENALHEILCMTFLFICNPNGYLRRINNFKHCLQTGAEIGYLQHKQQNCLGSRHTACKVECELWSLKGINARRAQQPTCRRIATAVPPLRLSPFLTQLCNSRLRMELDRCRAASMVPPGLTSIRGVTSVQGMR